MKQHDKITNNNPLSPVPRPSSQFIGDVITIVICLICSLFCIYLFRQDLNATFTRFGEKPIGTIILKNNLVQRRFIDRLVWDRLRIDVPMYNGDLIRTADLSEAIITFEFGDIVELYSNSMVQVIADHTGIRIDFARGGINVISKSENGVVVTSGDKRIAIDPGAVIRAFSFRDGELDLSVSEGEAFLENLFGESELLSLVQGSAVKYDASGQVVNIPQAIPIYPVSGSQILTEENSVDIPFVWSKVNSTDAALTRLEIAYDRDFNRIVYSGNLAGNHFTHKLGEGLYFWRVNPLDSAAEEGIYSRLTITKTFAPELISPVQEQSIAYVSRSPAIRFQWTPTPAAVSYNIEAADNDRFTNPSINAQVRATAVSRETFVSSALREGTWYWRVTPIYSPTTSFAGSQETEVAQTSSVGRFSITSGGSLSAPSLIAPSNNANINVETGRRDTIFSWRRDSEAESYTLRISADSSMSSPIIEHTTAETVYRYKTDQTEITLGTWYWTVQFTGREGTLSPVSQVRTFNAVHGEMVQRLVFPPDHYSIAGDFLSDTRFTWKTNLLNNRFQLSNLQDFSEMLVDEDASGESYTVRSLDRGDFFWRITGSTSTSEQLVVSPSRRFVVTDSLPPPDLSSPDSGVSAQTGVVVIKRGQRVNFSWLPIQGADYYIFKMHRGDSSTAPIMETIVYDTNISINMDNYEEDLHTWTVQGLTRASNEHTRRAGLSASQEIVVRHLRPVSLIHPRDGFEYVGLDAIRNPDMAEWFSPEEPVNVQFIIATDARMRNVVHRWDISMRLFRLPRLTEGDYYWMIKAETKEQYDISSSVAHFRVHSVPRLPAPLDRVPQDRHTITPKDIASSRALSFSWSPVQGASHYIVSVFQGTGRSRRTVVETQPIRERTYTIEDIRLLGRGTFSWQVEAVSILDDGFIEQRGVLQENQLVVDIPAPRNVRTRDSGVLYGL